MSEASSPSSSRSPVRVLLVLLPLAAVVFLGARYLGAEYERAARQHLETDILARLLGKGPVGPEKPIEFRDSDDDLLADPPAADAQVSPETLVFSYVATPDAGSTPDAWRPVLDALSDALGTPVQYVHYASAQDQLTALAAGELHITAINTGAVPAAVESCGFHPICTFGDDAGDFGYTMQLIVPADSQVTKPEEIVSHKVTFVTPDSNSGCKAPLVMLMDQYDLLPERDYEWGFSLDHRDSIQGVAAGTFEAAPVASDIIARMADDGEVDTSKLRTIKESERFPPVAIGYAHNLSKALREQVDQVLLGFSWEGTTLADQYGSDGVTRFVPVSYKDDWANIRRINAAVDRVRTR